MKHPRKPDPRIKLIIYDLGPWGMLRNKKRIAELEHKIECLEYELELKRDKN